MRTRHSHTAELLFVQAEAGDTAEQVIKTAREAGACYHEDDTLLFVQLPGSDKPEFLSAAQIRDRMEMGLYD